MRIHFVLPQSFVKTYGIGVNPVEKLNISKQLQKDWTRFFSILGSATSFHKLRKGLSRIRKPVFYVTFGRMVIFVR